MDVMTRSQTTSKAIRRLTWRLSAVALVAALGACSKADTAPAVATVSFTTSKNRVPLGSPLDLTYRFDVAPNAPPINGDYRVFVHVVDPDGAMLWSDDHDPPIPTSKWKAGQTIGPYTRTRFMPVVPYLGEVTVQVGLYKGDERVPLQGIDPADRKSTSRAYKVGTLQLLPQSENIFVIYKNGWHPQEFGPDNSLEWQWTQKSAVLTLRNPRQDVVFYLEYDARVDAFDHPQQVTVYAGDHALATFPADNSSLELRRIPITVAQLGANEMVELRIEVDRTFVPAKLPGGRDARELGIRVYHAFVASK